MTSRAICALLLGLLACAHAAAHTRSQSFSSWQADGRHLVGIYQVAAQRVTQLSEQATPDNLDRILASHLAQSVIVAQAGDTCPAAAPRSLPAARGDMRVELSYDCPRPIAEIAASVDLGAFFDVSPSHVHYARVARAGGQAREVLATVRSHRFEVGGSGATGPTDFSAFVRLGVGHVLSGIDHLAFILALALLAGGLGRAAWAATGFTLGHSLTLGLVAVGWLSPDVRSIEAMIGFTVAFAAAEAFATRDASGPSLAWLTLAAVAVIPALAKLGAATLLPWTVIAGTAVFAVGAGGLGAVAIRRLAPLLATAFGLAHGAGFAGALLELDIPSERLLRALLGFNLGVEVAQLLALAVIAAVAVGASTLPVNARRRAIDGVAICLFALGVYWFLGRSVGLA